MTWRFVLAAAVGVALLGSALALAGHEPTGRCSTEARR